MIQQHPDLVGQHFGRYRLLRLLGAGTFAEVYLGKHIDLGTQAAIKVLYTELSPTDIDAFRTEARTIARLRHPHIIRILDFDAVDSMPFLVMDYATGGTMRERYPRGTIVPLDSIVSYVHQVADALQYAHNEKLIHRDIKPENILLDEHQDVLLSDFGIAVIAQNSSDPDSQNVIGTAAYMSPEQLQGKPHPASDQYSLGIVVYEWLCGRPPFEGSPIDLCEQHMFAPPLPLRQQVPTISPDVEYVIMIALQKDPKQRFGNIRAFANALQQASQVGQAQIITSPPQDITLPTSLPEQLQPIAPPPPQTNNAPSAQPSSNIRPQGSQKWSFPTGGYVRSSLTAVNDVVYFSSGDHNLYALDTASGQQKWFFSVRNKVDSSPAVVNGVVYFGSDDRNLYALDAASGKPMWSFPTGNMMYSSPTVANDIVYVGSGRRNLYALDASSGRKIWSLRSDEAVRSSLTVVDGIIYFSSGDHHLYALDASSGKLMWSFPTGSEVHSSPTVANGIVYFGSDDHNFYALDASSGKLMWSFRSGEAVRSSPTVVDGIIYFGSNDHHIYAFDAALIRKIWSFSTDDWVTSSPIVVNGVVYVGSHDHNLYALNAASGQHIWSFQTGGKVQSSPTVVDDVVCVGSDDGKLYAIFA